MYVFRCISLSRYCYYRNDTKHFVFSGSHHAVNFQISLETEYGQLILISYFSNSPSSGIISKRAAKVAFTTPLESFQTHLPDTGRSSESYNTQRRIECVILSPKAKHVQYLNGFDSSFSSKQIQPPKPPETCKHSDIQVLP